MSILQVRISVFPVPPGFAFEGREFLNATDALLKRICGGSCVGVVEDGQITLEARANSKEEFASVVESYCRHFREAQRRVEIVIVDVPNTALSEGKLAAGARLNTTSVKLTKSFFMKQAAGVFLVSHVMGRGFEPIFAEPTSADDGRSAQWKRIREMGADQRACHTFPNQAHFTEWQKEAIEFFRAQAR